jgi:hypothetical protein
MTITYVRRLNVATAFVYAAGGLTGLELSPQQKTEVLTYANNLDAARKSLHTAIQAFLSLVDAKTNTTSSSKSSSKLAEFCNKGVCRPFGAGGLGAAAPKK